MRTPADLIRQRAFEADYRAMVALSDARRADNARARARCQQNAELCAVLLAEAQRRGQAGIDWPEYFRNVWLND